MQINKGMNDQKNTYIYTQLTFSLAHPPTHSLSHSLTQSNKPGFGMKRASLSVA